MDSNTKIFCPSVASFDTGYDAAFTPIIFWKPFDSIINKGYTDAVGNGLVQATNPILLNGIEYLFPA